MEINTQGCSAIYILQDFKSRTKKAFYAGIMQC